MVRQRKSHTRVKKGPAAQSEVLSGDGQPDEGETGEGTTTGTWVKVRILVPQDKAKRPGGGHWKSQKGVVGPGPAAACVRHCVPGASGEPDAAGSVHSDACGPACRGLRGTGLS